MGRRKRVAVKLGEELFITVRTGGPKKVYNRRRIRNPNGRKSARVYEKISAKWFVSIIAVVPAARRQKHLSQQSLAGLLGTSQAEISRLESGLTNPTVEFLERLASVLGIKITVSL